MRKFVRKKAITDKIMIKLIADSGSTKTDWCVIDGKNIVRRFCGQGINPFQQETTVIERILTDEVIGKMGNTLLINEVHFYGAGCRKEIRPTMIRMLSRIFSTAGIVEVSSDLLAAAHALFADDAGIVCILGTGSNSCLYNGHNIVSNVPPLGYILGDEGSGAVLGRMFFNAMYKGRLPKWLQDTYKEEEQMSLSDLIHRVYREPLANRFLASTSHFIKRHIDCHELNELVIENFRTFFHRNVSVYDRHDMAVGAVGSMAFYYKEQLYEAAKAEGFNISKIMKSPMDGLINYLSDKY